MADTADPTGTAETAPPTCYRHPGRETYVRCTRCDRPICPDCMHPAAVGFHCPDDVRAGIQSVRAPRTAFGGRIVANTGAVTYALIGLNVAFFLVGLVIDLTLRFGLIPGPVIIDSATAGVATGQYYRLVTAAFLHAGVFHLLANMYALFLVGPPLEAGLGRARFLALYLLSALGGSALSYALHPAAFVGVGASGAVFGLFAGLFVLGRRLRQDTSQITVLLLINGVLGFVVPRIDWVAHLGGALVGALVTLGLIYAPRERRTTVQTVTVAAAALLVSGTVAARTLLA